jgi:protein-arginine kinase activator protein McsA
MPSMKCYHCGKVKRCRMIVTRIVDVTEEHKTVVEYLCGPCARELGYANDTHDEGGEA